MPRFYGLFIYALGGVLLASLAAVLVFIYINVALYRRRDDDIMPGCVWQNGTHSLASESFAFALNRSVSGVGTWNRDIAQGVKEALDDLGFCVVHGFLSPARAAVLRSDILSSAETLNRTHTSIQSKENRLHFLLDPFTEAIVEELLRDLGMMSSGIPIMPIGASIVELAAIIARPGAKDQPWHPDIRARIGDAKLVTVAIALQDTTSGMGATQVSPRSHKCGQGEGFPLEFPAGSALLWDSRLFHRGGAHSADSNVDRVILYFTYAEPKARGRFLPQGATYALHEHLWGHMQVPINVAADLDSSIKAIDAWGHVDIRVAVESIILYNKNCYGYIPSNMFDRMRRCHKLFYAIALRWAWLKLGYESKPSRRRSFEPGESVDIEYL